MKIIASQRILCLSNKSEIHLPFGLSRIYKLALSNTEATLTVDRDKVVCIKQNERYTQIYPHYSKAISIPKLPPLNFSIVVSEKDKKACAALISEVHYLASPNKGIFFALKDRSEVIACCILDSLQFGNPKGRYFIDPQFCSELNISYESWGSTPLETRESLRDHLKLIWVSRIARAERYRGYDIGAYLMEETLKALPAVLPFSVKHVEVIRTCRTEDANSPDFLERAGFAKIKMRNQSASHYLPDGDLYPRRRPYVKFYYWKKIDDNIRFENSRLFVPLSQEPFSWFADNQKTWELRRLRGQFTERHIYPGKSIELRLGYNTNKKLWGIINKVITGSSIGSVLEKVGDFKSVIPTAFSLEDATAKANEILVTPCESYIAFEITALLNPDDLKCQI